MIQHVFFLLESILDKTVLPARGTNASVFTPFMVIPNIRLLAVIRAQQNYSNEY
jgi:hypothetical protein